MVDIKSSIRTIPDFPKKGIMFRDITTLLKNRETFSEVVRLFCDHYRGKKIDKVVSVESRGFIFGSVLAYELGAGFVPIRKPGKLPADVVREEYQLEYGTDAMEIHKDAISPGDRVLVHDDLLATGGTVAAACRLIERLHGSIEGICFLVELTPLNGRKRLPYHDIYSLIEYDTD